MKYFKLFFLQIIIACLYYSCGSLGDYKENLSGEYYYSYEGKELSFITNGIKVIPCDVISFDYDDEFIIVKQKHKSKCTLPNEYYKFLKTGSINYWIIHVKIDSIYGPYSRKEFDSLRTELNVDKSLDINANKD